MKTFAFKNSQKYWSTRYSFTPRNYSTLDRDMFTSHPTGFGAMYIHGPKASADKNTFYGTKISSKIKFTFNNDPSQNKIYKNISLEGSFGEDKTNISGTFKANDSTDSTQARPSSITGWKEKGSHLHATVANSSKSGRSNIEPVGVFRRAHQIFFPQNVAGLENLFDQTPLGYSTDVQVSDATGPYIFPLGIRNELGDDPMSAISEIDPEAIEPDTSRYLFFEIDFFPGYKDSSKEVKYIIDTSSAPFIQYIQGKPFNEIQSDFFSNKKLCAKAKNKGVLDFREKVLNDDNEFDFSGGLSVDGTKSKSGILVYTTATDIPGESPIILFDADGNGDIGSNDLLGFLAAFGEDPANVIFDSNGDGAISTGDLLDFLVKFGSPADEPEPFRVPNYVDAINNLQSVLNEDLIVYAVTPTSLNGEASRGNYADVSLTFPGSNFELDIINLDYEPTQLDHSR